MAIGRLLSVRQVRVFPRTAMIANRGYPAVYLGSVEVRRRMASRHSRAIASVVGLVSTRGRDRRDLDIRLRDESAIGIARDVPARG